jgi:mRNA interferase YafQ
MMKQGRSLGELDRIIRELAAGNGNALPADCFDHSLKDGFDEYRECHVETNWLLLYGYERLCDGTTRLLLVRTGNHSDLFA